jgi:glucokinase
MTIHIAVDIGGTRMRAASYPIESLDPTACNRIKTRKKNSTPIERLAHLISSVWPEDDEVSGIGIAVPGPVNTAEGIIEKAPNIPELSGLPVADIIQDTFNVPAYLGNDANLAALGEWKFGAGHGHHYLVYLTISTGIGSGVIINDQLFTGARGFASELGHTIIDPVGPICSCGVRGHLEALASGTAISKWVADQILSGAETNIVFDPTSDEPIPGSVIADAARGGDILALHVFERVGHFLGQAIADFLHIFNPTIIVLGGGVSQSYSLFSEALFDSMKSHVMAPEFLDNLTIEIAKLGDDVGLMGALAYAREMTVSTPYE